MRLHHFLAAAVLLLASCSIQRAATPVPDHIFALCIESNPAVHMEGFLPALVRQVEMRGVRTEVVQGPAPGHCRHVMRYTATWRWDLAMYLYTARLEILDAGRVIGSASYDASAGGLSMEKFGSTEGKIGPMVSDLLHQ
ncbi:hypothetical protein LNKW23_00320 [Paralimibaculum aggregatum]|uniref:Lipoprotein n=1 Tax=Paralimibaculum aggregatum TaxID=3036245 RepID=A0ABQ6LBN8_9RHOB|nr:Sbal_3080 family lipoprotein [Limibaculum sp. NKW23]GMG80820.1 hypothetical protein LNKW23_00320 [Limibaculum sp. NKW23]